MNTAAEQVNWAKGKVSRVGRFSKNFVISTPSRLLEFSRDSYTFAEVRYLRRKLIASIALNRYTPVSEECVNRVARKEMQVLDIFKRAKELFDADSQVDCFTLAVDREVKNEY